MIKEERGRKTYYFVDAKTFEEVTSQQVLTHPIFLIGGSEPAPEQTVFQTEIYCKAASFASTFSASAARFSSSLAAREASSTPRI